MAPADSAEQGRGTDRRHKGRLAFRSVPICGDRSELAGPKSNRVGCIRLNRQNPHAKQRRKRQKRAAARHGIESAGEERSDDQPGVLPVRTECHGVLF